MDFRLGEFSDISAPRTVPGWIMRLRPTTSNTIPAGMLRRLNEFSRVVCAEKIHSERHSHLFLRSCSGRRNVGKQLHTLGVRIENIRDNGSRIIIKSKVWKGIEQDFLKTDNGEREIDLPKSVAKLLIDFIGDRKSGFLFCSKNSKPLSESNIVNRWLHPMLEQLKAPKAGNHAFRRFRVTHLRRNLVPKDLEHFWMGHADEEIGDLYSKLMNDLPYRKDVAERIGAGFNVPSSLNTKAQLNLVEPKVELDETTEAVVSF